MMDQCLHPQTEARKMRTNGGGIQVRDQCLVCGVSRGNALKQSDFKMDDLPWWDDDLKEEYRHQEEQEREYARREAVSLNQHHEALWWREYNEYLRTPQWRALRQRVIRRDGGRCQGCGEQEAVDVHHKTYAHVGAEFMFELESVCRDCHKRLHPHMEGAA